MPHKADVVICGAGIAGVATAYYLAQKHGITDVALVDKRAPLTLTSDKSVEGYRNWWPTDVMARFMNRSIDLMEAVALETDNAIQLNRRGYAYVTTDPQSVQSYKQTTQHYGEDLGLGPIRIHDGVGQEDDVREARYVASSDDDWSGQPEGADLLLENGLIKQAYSYLAPDVQAIIHARRCGWLSAQQLGMYFLEGARKLGIREVRGEVVGIQTDEAGVSAIAVIRENSGVSAIQTRRFVNAAGPFLSGIGELLGLDLPVRSVLHQKIVMRDHLGIVARDAPLIILTDTQHLPWSDEERDMWAQEPGYEWLLDEFPGGVHIRPEGGEDSPWLLLGWGFHSSASQPVWEPEFSAEFPEIALRGALKLVPGLAQYVGKLPQPVMHDGGFYTKTQENLPLIGPLAVEGSYAVGALSGYGMMAGAAAGELGADWVAGASLPDYAERLSIQRYNDAAYMASLAEQGASGEL